MALFCCRYLSSQPFLQPVESDNFQNALRSGYFGLLDYATVHYFDHAQEAQKNASSLPADIVTSVRGLLTTYSDKSPSESSLEMEVCAQTVTNALSEEKIDVLIQARVVAIRAAMESRHHDLSKEDAYLDLSGPLRFKCPKVFCSNFTNGFRYQNTRDRHLDTHEQPYRCAYTDCFRHDVGYESCERLEAHCKAFHRDTVNLPATFPSTKYTKPKDIFEACKQGNLELVKKFHGAGAQLDKGSPKDHMTPLYLATQGRHANVCEYLVSQGINPFEGARYGQQTISPMFAAIRQGGVPLIELFLHTRRDFRDETIISQYPRCIAIAIMARHLDTLEILLGSRHCPDHAAIVADVLQELSHPSWSGTWPAELPADSSLVHTWFRRAFPNLYHDEISASGANCLIKKPGSTEYRTCHEILLQSDNEFLHRALGGGCHPLSMFLLDFADEHDLQSSDARGRLPMRLFVEACCNAWECKGCPVIMERIIEVGGPALMNIPNAVGDLPIHLALEAGQAPWVVQALISHTTNLNHKNRNGESPIHLALSNLNRLSMLLATGRVDLFITNDQGQSVFSAASEGALVEVKALELLLEADPTLAWTSDVSKNREMPLHHVMRLADMDSDQEEKAKLLLSLPTVERVLHEFSASPAEGNALACDKVRAFARRRGLERAIEVMDRIGFGL